MVRVLNGQAHCYQKACGVFNRDQIRWNVTAVRYVDFIAEEFGHTADLRFGASMSYHHNHSGGEPKTRGSFLTSRSGIVFVVFLAIAVFFLLTEHRAHLLGIFPFLLLLACPLLHMIHGGHGHDGHAGGDQAAPSRKDIGRSNT